MDNDLSEKLARARAAMAGDERRQKKEEEDKDLAAKRQQARFAMEGTERRQKREEEEKERTEKEEMKRKIDEEVKKRRSAENEAKTKEEETEKRLEAEEEKIRQARLDRIERSESLIDEIKKETSTLNPLRTLKSDTDRAINQEQLSSAKIAIKTQERQQSVSLVEEIPASKNGRGLVYIILSLLLIGSGIGGLYFVYQKNFIKTTDVNPVALDSIIFADENKQIDLDKITNKNELVSQINTALTDRQPAVGSITYLVFTKQASTTDNQTSIKTVSSFSDLATKGELNVPEYLLRFIDNNFMLGVYHSQEANYPFLILKIKSFQSAAAGMLNHETDFVNSLLTNLTGVTFDSNLTKTSFADKTIKNTDTRLLADNAGKTVVLYSFVDQTTLFIAPNEDTFTKILSSYLAPKPKI